MSPLSDASADFSVLVCLSVFVLLASDFVLFCRLDQDDKFGAYLIKSFNRNNKEMMNNLIYTP